MKAIPQKTALTDCFCPADSKASGSISWRVRKAITPPTANQNILNKVPKNKMWQLEIVLVLTWSKDTFKNLRI